MRRSLDTTQPALPPQRSSGRTCFKFRLCQQATGRLEQAAGKATEAVSASPDTGQQGGGASENAPLERPCTVGEGGEDYWLEIFMFYPKLRGTFVLTFFFVWMSLTSAAWAQPQNTGEVFITANRWGESVESVLSDVQVINRADIERSGAHSLPELLSTLPGIQATSYGGNNVYVRGAESRMTALYIDGVRIESHDGLQLGGGAPWGLITLDMIERIEIVKGPRSALYGSDAMGGVVQVFSKQSTNGVAKQISMGLGSQGTQQVAAALSGVEGKLNYSIRVGEKRSDGYNTRPDKVHIPDKEGWTDRFANVRFGWHFLPDHVLEWTAVTADRDEKMAAPYDGPIDIRQQSNLYATSLKWGSQWGADQSSQVQWSHGRNAVKSDAPNLYDSPNDYQTTTDGLLVQHQLTMPIGRFSFLAEHKTDRFAAMPTTYDPQLQASRSQDAGGLGYLWSQGNHSLRVNVRSDHYDGFGSKNTYATGYGWKITASSMLMASRASGFRAPTLEQMYGQYGSASLKPESNVSDEIAFEQRYGDSKWRATWFDNKVENLISSSQFLSTCSAQGFCYFNVGQAAMRGLTVSLNSKFASMDLDASYDYLDATDQTRQKQLSLRARNQLRLALSKSLHGVRMGAQIQAVGSRFDDAANTVELPGYALLNLFVQKQLTPEWTWLARVNNVTDHSYQQMGCTPGQCVFAAPGRNIFTSMTWRPKD